MNFNRDSLKINFRTYWDGVLELGSYFPELNKKLLIRAQKALLNLFRRKPKRSNKGLEKGVENCDNYYISSMLEPFLDAHDTQLIYR